MTGRTDLGPLPVELRDVDLSYLTDDEVIRGVYDATGACVFCWLRVRGVSGSGGDRLHDEECPLVRERFMRDS